MKHPLILIKTNRIDFSKNRQGDYSAVSVPQESQLQTEQPHISCRRRCFQANRLAVSHKNSVLCNR